MFEARKGMAIWELPTPAILVDLDKLQRNIDEGARLAKASGKGLWPMVKTHKSLEISRMQSSAGATGFLCGTVAEAEMLVHGGLNVEIMPAYPIADEENLARCLKLMDRTHLIFRLDCEETARIMDRVLRNAGRRADFVIKVDSGLNRFGVRPDDTVSLARTLEKYKGLNLVGVSTHPGLVYSAHNADERKGQSTSALDCLCAAAQSLRRDGFEIQFVTIGSTPSFEYDVGNETVTHVHPGNYVFFDAMQVALGIVGPERCALTVLVTAVSKRGNLVGIDAGVKVLSRDIGGHDITVVKGFGIVKAYPRATIERLSEEVGVLNAEEEPGIVVGRKMEVIPNHACVVNSQTSYLIGHRGGVVERLIPVEARPGV